jgi:uncharacterized protein DUF3489
VVAAMVAAQPKEIPMTKAKSKRKLAPRTNDSTTKIRNSVKRTTARKVGQLKSVTEPAAQQRPGAASQPTAGSESKKAHIIAMLQAPSGVTIETMARAAKWQPVLSRNESIGKDVDLYMPGVGVSDLTR